jgi:hypothetical protein
MVVMSVVEMLRSAVAVLIVLLVTLMQQQLSRMIPNASSHVRITIVMVPAWKLTVMDNVVAQL